MEIGSHDSLVEGVLNQEPSNGISGHLQCDEASVNGVATGCADGGNSSQSELHGGVENLAQTWGGAATAGQDGSADFPQHPAHTQHHEQHQPGSWGGGPAPHAVDMEDARNLVALSTSAAATSIPPMESPALPPLTSGPAQPQPCTAQLYEKFSQEMAGKTGKNGPSGWTASSEGEGERCSSVDINTLQTALSQAKHGHKPPNCDCDGPDCPDYLEWLEKKIKLATGETGLGKTQHCNMSEALHPHAQQHQQQHHQPALQPNGDMSSSCGQGATLQAHSEKSQVPLPIPCPLPPIPCSPSVLSIAKEKNISLETAIALEALTQLSATGPQTVVPPSMASSAPHASHPQQYPTQHLPSHSQHETRLVQSVSSRLPQQPVPRGAGGPMDPHSWEQQQHRPQCQGEAAHHNMMLQGHPSSYPPSAGSPFPHAHSQGGTRSPAPQHWPGKNSPRPAAWINPDSQHRYPHPGQSVGSDPMSELKQLLGDAAGKYTNTSFQLPPTQPTSNDRDGLHARTPNIKQEVDSGDYLGSNLAAMGQYGMTNGQQQYPPSQDSPHHLSIRHATQAALQQHLHHKRNLFSSPMPPVQRAPVVGQNLRKWWPQMGPDVPGMPMSGMPMMMPIKQEPKEPKVKSSPLSKTASATPKPKQIVIKKTKQKASLPVFMPQNQIVVQKMSAVKTLAALSLPGAEKNPALPPSLPLYNLPQAAPVPTPPAQSQESTLGSCGAHSSAPSITPAASAAPQGVPTTSGCHSFNGNGVAPGVLPSSTTLSQTSATQPSAPAHLPKDIGLDPKFEDLMRQFEEEFGDANTTSSSAAPTSSNTLSVRAPNPPDHRQPMEPQQDANSGQPQATSPMAEQGSGSSLPTPTDGQQPMEVGEQPTTSTASATGDGALSASNLASTPSQTLQPGDPFTSAGPCLPTSHGALSEQLHFQQQQQCAVAQDLFATPGSPASKRMKLESSGGVTVLSTTTGCFTPSGEEDTPTKDGLAMTPSLKGFLESPLRYLDTPTKNLLDTPAKDQPEFPLCDCVEQILEKDEGPYYNHLGAGPTVASIRELMENRYGEKGEAIRIEKVVYTGREGKSSQGCPIAKWVIRRSGEKEKLLCLVRHRAGHHCANAVIIIVIIAWEGVPRFFADKLYQELSDTLTKFGNATSRRCGFNDDRTCACQGKDPDKCGASFSFGCSWSMYFNGCKYARSKIPRKFRLQGDHPEDEDNLRDNFQNLATHVAPLYKRLAPQAYSNQCLHEKEALDCRLGLKEGRPFSGVTACLDFCAHAHKDQHNLHNGCTVVCTLTKEDNRGVGVMPDDEQLHVLPLYKVSEADEFGSVENQRLKMKNGAIQVLSAFRREVRKLPEPAKSCRQRRLDAKKAAMEKKKGLKTPAATPDKTIKTEMIHRGSPHPQLGNKAIKQEVKPNIKKEPTDRYHSFNGALPPGHPALGNGQAAEPYGGMKNAYAYPPGYYARGAQANGQTQAAAPMNGYHPNLPGLPYGYCNYPPGQRFPPEMMGYEGQNGAWPKGAAVPIDEKPDVKALQARLGHAYPEQSERQADNLATRGGSYATPTPSGTPQPPHSHLSRTPTPAELRRATPVIKQEPMDVPVYGNGCRPDSAPPGCPSTPGSSTPLPSENWPGHKPNGMMPKGWEGPHRPGTAEPSFSTDKQMLQHHPTHHHAQHLHPQQQIQQHHQQQWNHFQGQNTPLASPCPSPAALHRQSFSPAPSSHHPSTPRHWDSPSPSSHPKAWPAGFNPAVKMENPGAGGVPDRMLSQGGESRGSTPLGLQEKAWRSGGGSAAGSTPSPAPEGRLFPDTLLQRPDAQGCWTPCKAESETESQSEREPDEDEVWSDSEHNFLDPNIGGVAVAPAHGSVLIECARRELHATTPLKRPDRSHPSRISLVFYQHKNLNQPCHGLALWEAKMKLLAERALQRQQEAALLGLPPEDIKVFGKKRKWAASAAAGASASPAAARDKREGVATRLAPTLNTSSLITVSSYAYTQLTGPYSRLV